MTFACRKFSRSAESIMNLNPKTDYRSYTSVDTSNSFKAVRTDMINIARGLRKL